MTNIIKTCINAAIDDWDKLNYHDKDSVNSFISKHSSTICQVGLCMSELQIVPVSTDNLAYSYHKTLDGVLGILSMNMSILRSKLTLLNFAK